MNSSLRVIKCQECAPPHKRREECPARYRSLIARESSVSPADGEVQGELNVLRAPATRLRSVVVGVALLLLLGLQLFAAIVSGVSARSSALDVAKDSIGKVGDTTTESILRHLEPAEQSAEVTAHLLADDLLDTSAPNLERYLFTQLAVMPQMTGAFIGFPDGAFVFVAREPGGFRSKRIEVTGSRAVSESHYDAEFNLARSSPLPDDEYDPRQRPWYSLAAASDRIEWTDPYVFFSSGNPGVTTAKAVQVNGRTAAVVGVDVELTGLATFLDDLPIAASGEAFVVSGDVVVAAPSSYTSRTGVDADGTLRMLTLEELSVPALTQALDAQVQQLDTPTGRELVLHRSFPQQQSLRWSLVVRAVESDFTSIVRKQQRTTQLILLGGAAFLGLSFFVLRRITRPLVTLHDQATTDELTGLANRRSLAVLGASMVSTARRDGQLLSVLVLDLDGFKQLNDQFGHHAGDQALRAVASSLRSMTGKRDLVARLGGDEFVIVHHVNHLHDATTAARTILAGVADSLREALPDAKSVGASAGLTITDGSDQSFDVLLQEADGALLSSKSLTGKGDLSIARRLSLL
jgi:diguanylate cyclase (GGDEF)-like protein